MRVISTTLAAAMILAAGSGALHAQTTKMPAELHGNYPCFTTPFQNIGQSLTLAYTIPDISFTSLVCVNGSSDVGATVTLGVSTPPMGTLVMGNNKTVAEGQRCMFIATVSNELTAKLLKADSTFQPGSITVTTCYIQPAVRVK